MITPARQPTHYLVVNSKRGGEKCQFSFCYDGEEPQLRDRLEQTLHTVVEGLQTSWRTGPDNEKLTHQVFVQLSRRLDVRTRKVWCRNLHLPYHSSDEILESFKRTMFKRESEVEVA